MVEIPGGDAVELLLTILATFDDGPSHVGRFVSIQPLLAEHREERGEERNGEAGIQHGLDLDDHVWGAGPHRDCRSIATERGIVHVVYEDTKESDGLVAWVWLELGLCLDDEGGGHRGEQTSL